MIWFNLISACFQVNYRNHIALNLATAHPHYDDEGNTYNMGTALVGLGLPQYVIFKVPAEAAGTRTEAPGEGLKHDLDLCSEKSRRNDLRECISNLEPKGSLHSCSQQRFQPRLETLLLSYVRFPLGCEEECGLVYKWLRVKKMERILV